MLRFQVQGSGKAPYSITAEGEGPDFRIFCSCPAGRKGGMFCKHVAALLVGDVTKLIGPTDEIQELARRAAGSPLISQAMTHKSSTDPDPWAHIRGFEDVTSDMGAAIAALGFDLEISRDPGDMPSRLPRDELRLFGYFKNGKRRKTPSHLLSFEPLAADAVFDPETETVQYQNMKPRVRPWGFDGKTTSSLAKLIPDFRKKIGLT